jgi:hypothetical protein
MNDLTHNESYMLWRRQHENICLYSVIHLRNMKKAFGQYPSFQAVSDGPTGVGSVFFCLPPIARSGCSLYNIFLGMRQWTLSRNPLSPVTVNCQNLLKLCRSFFALSMCLTKFLLNTIHTLCTDMEVTILCCNLIPFLHITATCLLIHLSQSAGSVFAIRCRAEKN